MRNSRAHIAGNESIHCWLGGRRASPRGDTLKGGRGLYAALRIRRGCGGGGGGAVWCGGGAGGREGVEGRGAGTSVIFRMLIFMSDSNACAPGALARWCRERGRRGGDQAEGRNGNCVDLVKRDLLGFRMNLEAKMRSYPRRSDRIKRNVPVDLLGRLCKIIIVTCFDTQVSLVKIIRTVKRKPRMSQLSFHGLSMECWSSISNNW
jgi:hypothetical protein